MPITKHQLLEKIKKKTSEKKLLKKRKDPNCQ